MSPGFSPVAALVGGGMIGSAASAMLLIEGRIAGISGIVGGLFAPRPGDVGWRVAFVAGLVTAGALAAIVAPGAVAVEVDRGPGILAVAGLLVGVGTRLGNGCTSGHGVCGLSRGSPRSLASVVTFIAVGMLVAAVVGRLGGGG